MTEISALGAVLLVTSLWNTNFFVPVKYKCTRSLFEDSFMPLSFLEKLSRLENRWCSWVLKSVLYTIHMWKDPASCSYPTSLIDGWHTAVGPHAYLFKQVWSCGMIVDEPTCTYWVWHSHFTFCGHTKHVDVTPSCGWKFTSQLLCSSSFGQACKLLPGVAVLHPFSLFAENCNMAYPTPAFCCKFLQTQCKSPPHNFGMINCP